MNNFLPKLSLNKSPRVFFAYAIAGFWGLVFFIYAANELNPLYPRLLLMLAICYFIGSIFVLKKFRARGQKIKYLEKVCIPTICFLCLGPIALSFSSWFMIFTILVSSIAILLEIINIQTFYYDTGYVFELASFFSLTLIYFYGKDLYQSKYFGRIMNPMYLEFGKKLLCPTQIMGYVTMAFLVLHLIFFKDNIFEKLTGDAFRFKGSWNPFLQDFDKIATEYCKILEKEGLIELYVPIV